MGQRVVRTRTQTQAGTRTRTRTSGDEMGLTRRREGSGKGEGKTSLLQVVNSIEKDLHQLTQGFTIVGAKMENLKSSVNRKKRKKADACQSVVRDQVASVRRGFSVT